jgi:hypothetical protein
MLTSIAEGGALWYANMTPALYRDFTDPNHNSPHSPHHLSAYPYPEEDSPRVDPYRYVFLVHYYTI